MQLNKATIDKIVDAIIEHNEEFLGELKEEFENGRFALRFELEFFYPFPKMQEFDVEFMILHTNWWLCSCINIPGCVAEGDNFNDLMLNIIRAAVECCAARINNGKWFLNRVEPAHFYQPTDDTKSTELISELKEKGWDIVYNSSYNTVLLSNNSKVTFTIPHKDVLSNGLMISITQYFHVMSMKTANQIRREQVIENDYWSCDACGGDEDSGCLWNDPTECVR